VAAATGEVPGAQRLAGGAMAWAVLQHVLVGGAGDRGCTRLVEMLLRSTVRSSRGTLVFWRLSNTPGIFPAVPEIALV
jgi:hypothetical protein